VFAILKRKRGKGFLKKKNNKWKKYKKLGGHDFGRFVFLYNTKSISFGKLKYFIGGEF